MENNSQNSTLDKIASNQTSRSWAFKIAVIVLAELIILTAVFSFGVSIGFRKAGFTYSWSQNYPNNFGGARGLMPPPSSGQLFNSHGLDGAILSVNKNIVVIKDEDSTEKSLVISPKTTIRFNFQSLQPADLKIGQEIVVIGEPNPQGQIDAKLIRVLDQK
jgi:RNase P/RNase MRP subunit p29